jgi:COMPASS component SWD3
MKRKESVEELSGNSPDEPRSGEPARKRLASYLSQEKETTEEQRAVQEPNSSTLEPHQESIASSNSPTTLNNPINLNPNSNAPAPASESYRKPNYKLKFTIEGHKKSISSIKFSPDGKWLTTSCRCFRCAHLDELN